MNNFGNIVVVGIGNEFRRDDGIGLYVARRVEELADRNIKVVVGVSDGYALIDTWNAFSQVIVVDCAVAGNTPGTIYSFDAFKDKIPDELFDGFSTHSISIVNAIELAGTLGRLPKSLMVYGIEGIDYTPGSRLSAEVRQAADSVVEKIISEINNTTYRVTKKKEAGMHEHSLLKDLLKKIDTIAKENNSDKIVGVKVRLGALSHISDEHFREHFERAVKGTVAENAKLDVVTLTDISDPQAQEIILESVEVAG